METSLTCWLFLSAQWISGVCVCVCPFDKKTREELGRPNHNMQARVFKSDWQWVGILVRCLKISQFPSVSFSALSPSLKCQHSKNMPRSYDFPPSPLPPAWPNHIHACLEPEALLNGPSVSSFALFQSTHQWTARGIIGKPKSDESRCPAENPTGWALPTSPTWYWAISLWSFMLQTR